MCLECAHGGWLPGATPALDFAKMKHTELKVTGFAALSRKSLEEKAIYAGPRQPSRSPFWWAEGGSEEIGLGA